MLSPTAQAEEWKHVGNTDGVEIYERAHPGSSLREYKGIGTIQAPPIQVKRVLEDVPAFPKFMPYIVEARVLSTSGNSVLSYQRISPPVVGDRDYTVLVHTSTRKSAEGTTYIQRWETANEKGPAPQEDISRVKVTEGEWVFEPVAGGTATKATYQVYSDCGGAMPAMIVNMAGKTAVPKLFNALRKQVQLPKYAAAK